MREEDESNIRWGEADTEDFYKPTSKNTCDICGKDGRWIEPLKSEYATENVKGVCPECLRILNHHLDDIQKLQRKILFTWMQRFIASMRGKVCPGKKGDK